MRIPIIDWYPLISCARFLDMGFGFGSLFGTRASEVVKGVLGIRVDGTKDVRVRKLSTKTVWSKVSASCPGVRYLVTQIPRNRIAVPMIVQSKYLTIQDSNSSVNSLLPMRKRSSTYTGTIRIFGSPLI